MATKNDHQDDFTRAIMICKLEEGHSMTSVAHEFGTKKSIVSYARKAFQGIGTIVRNVDIARSRKEAARYDLYIAILKKRE